MDLAEWYAARRWVALLDLIDGLPSACRLNEAKVNDPEMAAHIAAMPSPEEEWAPAVSEYNLTAHLLRETVHELKQVKQAVIASTGTRPPHEKPFPAPRTEVDRAIAALEREWAQSFIEQWGFDASDI